MTILKQAILLRSTSSSPVDNLLSEQIHHQLLVQSVDLPIDSGPVSPTAANGQLYSLQSAPVLEQLQPAQVILLHQSSGSDGGSDDYSNHKNLSINFGSSSINSPLPPSTGSTIAFSTSTSSSPMTGDLLIDDRSRSSSLEFGQLDTQLSSGESASQVPSIAEVPAATTLALSPGKTAENQQSTTTRQPGQNYGRFILSFYLCIDVDSNDQ